MIRVVIADDHTLVREGIGALLDRSGDMEVVGAASNGVEALSLMDDLQPDVLVLDLTMPEMTGVEVMEKMRNGEAESSTAVVVLSMHADGALVRRAMQAGARAYVLKDSVSYELLTAIRAAHRGATYVSPPVADIDLFAEPDDDVQDESQVHDLTPREHEVLKRVAEGETNRAIAHGLAISVKTVERHRTAVMTKLGAHNIVELIRIALRHGLIDLDDR